MTNVYLQGAATVFVLHQLVDPLEKLTNDTNIHIHFETLSYIDHACLMHIQEWAAKVTANGGAVRVEWDTLARRSRGLYILNKVS